MDSAQLGHTTGTGTARWLASMLLLAHTVPSTSTSAPPSARPASHRLSLALLLVATAALYLVGLSASGYANSFYSAAAQAGSVSWKAWFFASLDAGNAITVDKPPAALWLTGLSVRLFGLSSWSILVPQALCGVASVAVLYCALRRALAGDREGGLLPGSSPRGQLAHWAALAGAASLALTPAATLIFRYNNPDALLVLLEVCAAWAVTRATQTASRKHLALAGALVGLGFLTKMMQVFLVLPAFVLAYALCAPTTWRRRVTDLFVALGALLASAGWYIALFELVPSSWRPYMGGSQTNSLLELAFGYNGLARITGAEAGGLGNGGSSSGVGPLRIFQSVSGGMISWLVPAALLLAAGAWWVLGRRAWHLATPRTAPSGYNSTPATLASASLLVWSGWMLVTTAVFSSMSGIYHDYYTVAVAPGIAGTVAVGGAVLWAHRERLSARVVLALASSATGIWAVLLLARAGGAWTILGLAVVAVCSLSALALLASDRLTPWLQRLALALAVVAALAGPAGYSVNTASTAHTGSIVTAGPVSGGMGGGAAPVGAPGGTAGAPGGAPGGGAPRGGAPGGGQPGGMGGVLGGTTVSDELVALLTSGSGSTTWAAATVGAQNAASYQLATELPVIALGGFNGTDPAPTLAGFQQMVADGQVHWFIGDGSTGMPGSASSGSDDAARIAEWVAENFTAQSVGGTTVYDLTQG